MAITVLVKLPPFVRHNISEQNLLYFLRAAGNAFFKFQRLSVMCFSHQPVTTDTCNPSVFQVSANGNVLRSEIVGSIKMRVFLSGMPELRLGLNDKVLFENTGREFTLITDFTHIV